MKNFLTAMLVGILFFPISAQNCQIDPQAVPSICGQPTGAVTLSVLGGPQGYTFLWSNGATTQNITGLMSGQYCVTATHTSGCSAVACATVVNQGVQTTYYRDADNDGFGNPAVTQQACSQPNGYVTNSADCNDNNAAVNPGATEVCDGVDNNCNGQTDEGVQTIYYRDMDGDGFGNPAVTQQACTQPAGYVTNNTDCNDNNPLEKPGQVWYADLDGDGYSNGWILTQCLRPTNYYVASELISITGDCNDNNAIVHYGAMEVCNGMDDDCDGQIDENSVQAGFAFVLNGNTANFTNTSQNATQYVWSFGDGGTSTEQNPMHSYNQTGSYLVTLVAVNCTYGCHPAIFTALVTIVGCEAPDPSFSYTDSDNGYIYVFVNTPEPGATYQWSFGDGAIATGATVTHIYLATGTYVITVTATNNCGTSSHIETIFVEIPVVGCVTASVGNEISCGVWEVCSSATQVWLFPPTGLSGGVWEPGTFGDQSLLVNTTTMVIGQNYNFQYIVGGTTYSLTLRKVNCITGTDEQGLASFNIFPNPTSGVFTVKFTTNSGPVTVSLLNVLGQKITNDQLDNFTGAYNRQFDLSQQPKGVYLIQVQQEGKIFARQVILR